MARFESELLSWMKMVESAVEFLSWMAGRVDVLMQQQQQQPLVVALCSGSVRHYQLHMVTMVQGPVALTNRSGLSLVVVVCERLQL